MTEQRITAAKDAQGSSVAAESRLETGAVAFSESSPSQGKLWILLSGSLLLSRGGRPVGQMRKVPAAIDPVATFTLSPHRVTAQALEPSRLLCIEKKQLPHFFQAKSPWAVHLLGQMAAALDSDQILTELEPYEPPAILEPAAEEEIPDAVLETQPDSMTGSGEIEIEFDAEEDTPVIEPAEAVMEAEVEFEDSSEADEALAEDEADFSDSDDSFEAGSDSISDEEMESSDFETGPELPVPEALANLLFKLGSRPMPKELDLLVKQRLLMHARFESLDQDQSFLLDLQDLPAQAASELRRQKQLLSQPPDAETVETNLKDLETRVAEGQARRTKGDSQAPEPRLLEAWLLGVEQYRLLTERDQVTPEILRVCSGYASEQPLHAAMKRLAIDPDRLFGLSLFAIVLKQRSAAELAKAETLRQEREQISAARIALTAKAKESKQRFNELVAAEEQARLLASWTLREARWIERELVQVFWMVYGELARKFTSGAITTDDDPFVRAFLRWGLLGCCEPYIRPAVAQRILAECAQPLRQCRPGLEQEYVLYADEYLELTVKGLLTPSVDEQLELDRQKVDDRAADRTHRKLIHDTAMRAAYQHLISEIEVREQAQYQRITQLAAELTRLDPKDKEYRAAAQKIREEEHDCKVEAARMKRSVEHVRNNLIGRIENEERELRKRQKTLAKPLTPEMIVEREVAGLRRVCRLASNRQDVYLPFALAESFQVEQQRVHDRQAVIQELREAEKRDPLIFQEQVIPHKQRSRRVYLRHAPIVLIAPTRGVGSFSWNPRYATESGRLVVPCLSPESRRLRRILWEVLADFRYDTSKQSAGVDFLASDTLAAAYATVRWNFKRRSREVRQKAAIYKEETDKMNWRRHYELYMRSAMEGGKLLYYKCADLYKPLLKYIALPDGVEQIRNN